MDNHKDDFLLQQCCPPNYLNLSQPRPGINSGFLCAFYLSEVKLHLIRSFCDCNFDLLCAYVRISNLSFILVSIHRCRRKNVRNFIYELHSQLGDLVAESHRVIIIGDINIHLGDATAAQKLWQSFLQECSLKLFMAFSTYSFGHILNHLFSSENLCLEAFLVYC